MTESAVFYSELHDKIVVVDPITAICYLLSGEGIWHYLGEL